MSSLLQTLQAPVQCGHIRTYMQSLVPHLNAHDHIRTELFYYTSLPWVTCLPKVNMQALAFKRRYGPTDEETEYLTLRRYQMATVR